MSGWFLCRRIMANGPGVDQLFSASIYKVSKSPSNFGADLLVRSFKRWAFSVWKRTGALLPEALFFVIFKTGPSKSTTFANGGRRAN